jgi:hypothetical protein
MWMQTQGMSTILAITAAAALFIAFFNSSLTMALISAVVIFFAVLFLGERFFQLSRTKEARLRYLDAREKEFYGSGMSAREEMGKKQERAKRRFKANVRTFSRK